MSMEKKRFWTNVAVRPADDGYEVTLDKRPIKTPAKAQLVLQHQALADAIAQEWSDVKDTINPDTMPATRMANSVIDKVMHNRAAVQSMLGDYGASDLICYRADGPEKLISLQAQKWDPLIEWTKVHFGPLNVTAGVMPVDQPTKTVAALNSSLDELSDWQLAAAHDLITISGSLVIALALLANQFDENTAWMLSRIDEEWQIAQWGEDDDAKQDAAKKHADFLFAYKFFKMTSSSA